MSEFNKHETSIIKLLTKYSNLSIRRISIMLDSIDSLILAKKMVDSLYGKNVVYINDQQMVSFTPRFNNVIKEAHLKIGKRLPEKQDALKHSGFVPQPNLVSENIAKHDAISVAKMKNKRYGRTSAPSAMKKPTYALETRVEHMSHPHIIVTAPTVVAQDKVDMNMIRGNIAKITCKLNEEIRRPIVKNKNKRIEDLFYLSNIMPATVASVLRDIAMDIQQAN